MALGTIGARPESALLFAAICAVVFALAMACGGDAVGAGGSSVGGEVNGFVVDAFGRSITEIETFSVRDADGRVWEFTTEGPVGTTASHLRQHQITGETILVVYIEKGGRLVATSVSDAGIEHGTGGESTPRGGGQ